jgi:tetratricopeptide (TPR) repeat protein
LVILWVLANFPALREAFAVNAGFLAFNHNRAEQKVTGDSLDPELARYSMKYLERAVRINPTNASAWRALGYLLMESGAENEALDAWRNVTSIADELFKNGLQADSGEEALDWYQRALAIDPEFIDARLAVGFIYEEMGEMALAEAAYSAGHETAPYNSDLLYYLGRAQTRRSQQVEWETVLALVNRAIAQDNYLRQWSRFQSYYLRGEALRNLDHKQEALADYNVVLEGYPNDYWATLRLAELTWELEQDMQAAEKYFRAAIAIDPNNKWAYRHFARDLSVMGRTEEAKELFEKVLSLDPDDRVASEWLKQNQ